MPVFPMNVCKWELKGEPGATIGSTCFVFENLQFTKNTPEKADA
jgi:hypothetical protein